MIKQVALFIITFTTSSVSFVASIYDCANKISCTVKCEQLKDTLNTRSIILESEDIYNYGYCVYKGLGFIKDKTKGAEIVNKACESGSKRACSVYKFIHKE